MADDAPKDGTRKKWAKKRSPSMADWSNEQLREEVARLKHEVEKAKKAKVEAIQDADDARRESAGAIADALKAKQDLSSLQDELFRLSRKS